MGAGGVILSQLGYFTGPASTLQPNIELTRSDQLRVGRSVSWRICSGNNASHVISFEFQATFLRVVALA